MTTLAPLTDEQIDALEGRDLDAAVAEHIMGYRVDKRIGRDGTEVWDVNWLDKRGSYGGPIGRIISAGWGGSFTFWQPHINRDDCAAVEERIIENGYGEAYFWKLNGNRFPSKVSQVLPLITAMPDVRCKAMLKALGETLKD